MPRKLLMTVLALLCFSSHAQELSVKSFKLLSGDETAQVDPVLDNRGDPCALVKIKAGALKDLIFSRSESQLKKAVYDEQQLLYLVYIPSAVPRLDITHTNYLPLCVDFKQLGNGKKLVAGNTYLLTLDVPEVVVAASGSKVLLKVTPVTATVKFDGKAIPSETNGVYELSVEPGSYGYVIEAKDHTPSRGTVTVSNGETKTVNKQLKPIMHQVYVNCTPDDAKIYVDNVFFGQAGLLSLPQGIHNIHIQAKKANEYIDKDTTVTILSSRPMSFVLKKNQVPPVRVTVYNEMTDKLYLNGYEVPRWRNGGIVEVQYIPGRKYLFSDDHGNEKRLEIKNGMKTAIVKF